MSTEQDLSKRAARFELPALGEIYDAYSPGIYGYALKLLGNADLAEECVAQVFERLLQALKDGKGPKQFLRAYLYRIAHNWIADQYRRAPPILPIDLEQFGASTPTLHEFIDERADAGCLRQAIAGLTEEQRQVIVLKYMEDMTNEEIAGAMGKPVGAIKSLQHRALASLQRAMNIEEHR